MKSFVLKSAALSLTMLIAQPLQASGFNLWTEPEQAVFNLVNLQRELNGVVTLVADSRLHDAALVHSNAMSNNNFFSHTGSDGSDGGQRILTAGYNWNQGGWGENIAAGYGVTFSSGGGVALTSALDAARLVMYGTADLAEISNYSTSNGQSGFNSWDTVGTGWSGNLWDSWHANKNFSGGWMGSSGHRDNILTGLFTDLGVGLVFDPNDQTIPNVGGPFYSYWTQNFAAGDTAPVPLPAAFWLFAGGLALLRLSKKSNPL